MKDRVQRSRGMEMDVFKWFDLFIFLHRIQKERDRGRKTHYIWLISFFGKRVMTKLEYTEVLDRVVVNLYLVLTDESGSSPEQQRGMSLVVVEMYRVLTETLPTRNQSLDVMKILVEHVVRWCWTSYRIHPWCGVFEEWVKYCRN